jgi:polyferredoxin
LCIDASDAVIGKINRPTRLIACNADVTNKRHGQGLPPIYKLIRLRAVLYSAVIAVAGSVILYALTPRTNTGLAALHDRNPLFTHLSDGAISNGYELRIANKAPRTRRFRLEMTRLGGKIEVVGANGANGRAPSLDVVPGQIREVRVLATTSAAPEAASTPVTFQIIGSHDDVARKRRTSSVRGAQ